MSESRSSESRDFGYGIISSESRSSESRDFDYRIISSESRASESRVSDYSGPSFKKVIPETKSVHYGAIQEEPIYNSLEDIDTLLSKLEEEKIECIKTPGIQSELSRREKLILELKELRKQAMVRKQEEEALTKLKSSNLELEHAVEKIRKFIRPTSSSGGWFESSGESHDGESNW